MTTRKTIALTIWTFVGKVTSLLFNTRPRFVIAFLLRSKHLLISWLQSPSAVILEPRKIKSVTASIFFPSIYHEVIGMDAVILVFWMWSFKRAFSPSSVTLITGLFTSSSLYAIEWYHLHITLIFLPAVVIPACESSSLAFHVMHSIYPWNPSANTYIRVSQTLQYGRFWEFPGGPVVRTLHLHCRGTRCDPWSGK